MKKIIVAIISFAVLITSVCSFVNAYADDGYIVNADDIYAKAGETVTVPLKLSGNNGLMGFRVKIKYPKNQLTLTDVSSGSLTSEGLFNTTITDYYSVKGSFDVVWSDSKETKSNGTLFIMTYKINEAADNGDYNISVTYSQEDTFNEKMNDVKLSCNPIKVYIGKEKPKDKKESTTKNAGAKAKNTVSADYLIASAEQIAQSFGANNLDEVKPENQKAVVEYVNNRVDSYGGGKKYSSFDELKSDVKEAAKNEAAKKVLESADPAAIVQIADEVLKEYGAGSFNEISAEKKKEAVDKMLQRLAEKGADEEGFKHINSIDDAALALDEIVKTAREEKDKTLTASKKKTANNGKKSGKTAIIISAVCAAIALIILLLIIIIKRRRKNEK